MTSGWNLKPIPVLRSLLGNCRGGEGGRGEGRVLGGRGERREEKIEVEEEYTSIEALDISNRAYNGLKRANINTIEELVQKK